MRLRAIIIDDEETGIETLKFLVEKYVEDVKVVAKTTRAGEAINFIENYKPEIVFLDISMPEMDGFELLEKLEWKNFHLIFTTAHQEYALKAIKLRAVDYLLKPIDQEDLCAAVERIKCSLLANENNLTGWNYASLNSISQYRADKLGVNSKTGIEYVDPFEIISLESKSNYTKVHLSDGRDILSPKTLGEFDNQLCDDSFKFMRVHHSFVINLQKVARYIKDADDIIMVDNQKIPLSKSRRENFFKWLDK